MKYALVSLLLSLVVLSGAIWVNFCILQEYQEADRKTQALFSLRELLAYSFKYYFLFGSLISGVLLIIAFRRNENQKMRIAASVFLLLSVSSVVLRIWTWFL